MNLVCPNYKSTDFINLVKHFKGSGLSQKEAENEAMRVFLAHNESVPMVGTLTEIKKDIVFQSTGISDLKKAKMLNALHKHNVKHNSSHSIIFKPTTPTSYKAELRLNFYPKSISGEVPAKMNKVLGKYSGVEVETIEDPDVFINSSAGEYVVDGEIYPSYEDAKNSLMFQKSNSVNYILKAVNILSSDRAKQIFNKGTKNNWDINKILQELQIPKEEKVLIIESYNNGNKTLDELAVDIASKYTYDVEVNTAKTGAKPFYDQETGEYYGDEDAQYYSNLTVPGGTNYTENEISSPLITPSIKGHAQFSTDQGIGWFRSDDRSINADYSVPAHLAEMGIEPEAIQGELTKTRRILEVQSDLFQKSRGKEKLISGNDIRTKEGMNPWDEDANYEVKGTLEKTTENQFLQLLNKNNNWVTFFIKSIIQDSAKKGYEKVLFPKGETAAKIEGHETIAEELRILEDNIQQAKEKTKREDLSENRKQVIQGIINENEKRKQELKSQGIEKLKPIEAFYEIKVGNILEKQFGKDNIKTITDEYGNQWREIKIDKSMASTPIFLQKNNINQSKAIRELDEFLKTYLGKFGVKVEYIDNFMEKYKTNAVAVADMSSKMISVAKGREDSTTLPEEAAHFIFELLGEEHELYKAADKIIESTDEYKRVVEEYSGVYNGDKKMLRKEAMGKILSDYIIKRHKKGSDLPVTVNNLFMKIFNWFKDTFSKMKENVLEAEKERIFSQLANEIAGERLSLKTSNLTSKKNVFAQIDQVQATLSKAIQKLERKAAILKETGTRGEEQGRAEELRESLGYVTQEVEHNLAQKQYAKAIVTYLQYIADTDLKWTLEEIEKHTDNPQTNQFSATQIIEVLDMINMYKDTVNDIHSAIAFGKDKSVYNSKIGNTDISVKDLMNDVITKINFVENFIEQRHKEKAIEILDRYQYEGSEHTSKEILESAVSDLNWLQLNFGSLRNATDDALRIVYRIVHDIYNKTYKETLDRGKTLMDLQIEMEKSGISMKEIHDTYNGKKTGFMISAENWGEYYEEKRKARKKVAKELGYEKYSDIDWNELTSADKKKYNNLFDDLFRNKYEQKISGVWVPRPPKNERFAKLMQNKAFSAYYTEMKLMMDDARKMLPTKYQEGRYNKMLLPQIRKDIMQTIKDKEGKLWKELGSRVKESFLSTSEDTEFGSSVSNSGVMLDVNGKVAKLVPIHYVTKISNTDQLSNDTTSMVAAFYEMASNFKNMSTRVDELTVVQNEIAKRETQKRNVKSGIDSNAYKALDQFLDSFVYGKYKEVAEFKIPGTNIVVNGSKLADRITAFVRGNNLFMNTATTISGFTKASIDATVDKWTGYYTTAESGLWAEKEFDLNLPKVMENLGKRQKTGKVSLMFEYNGIFNSLNETFNRLDMKSKLGRATSSDLIYSTYTLADLRIKGKLALSIYDNYRLVDSKFITKSQFKRKYGDTNRKWEDYKDETLYNAYEVRNGRFKAKKEYSKYITEDLENAVKNTIEHRGAAINGHLAHLDRPAIAKSILGRFLMIHRGWLVSGLSERFKKRGMNYDTGEMEEGFYRSTGRALVSMLSAAGGMKAKAQMWHTLDDFQKRNIIKFAIDLSFSALIIGMSAMVAALEEGMDDDDWWLQYLGYQMSRIQLEQTAFINPKEFAGILNSPTAATGLITTATGFIKLFSDWDKIEYGAYEGMYQFEKALIKNSLLKNIWELQAPEQKNKYIKTQMMR